MRKLVLGSSSPRRVELLSKLGVSFNTNSPDIDETVEEPMHPREFVSYLAKEKAKALIDKIGAENLKGKLLLTADTTVAFGNENIGKPEDKADAKKILQKLSGQTHKVYTAVCYTYETEEGTRSFEETVSVTDVLFKDLDEKEIDQYISRDEPYDKAGAYAIQGDGAFMVKAIHGSYTNVMGLPLAEVSDDLKRLL